MRADGYLVYDGCWLERALSWHYNSLPEHQPLPVLIKTDYHALTDLGPILVQARVGDGADLLWQTLNSPIRYGVWLETTLTPLAMLEFMQTRLHVSSASGQDYWLRLTDSRPLLRAFQSDSRWPDGFWDGIDAIWLNADQGPFEVWRAPTTHLSDLPTVTSHGQITPCFTLEQATLNSLAGADKESLV